MNARATPPAEGEAKPVTSVEVSAQETTTAPRKGGFRRTILMICVPLVLAVAGGYFWLNGGRYADTDNAYVQQAIVSLSSDISGRIIEVDVAQNQTVKQGDVLFRIDPEPFSIALDQAQATLAATRIQVEQLRVGYETAKAKLDSTNNTLDIRLREQDRIKSLEAKGFSTPAVSDSALLATQQAQSAHDLASQAVDSAAAALGGDPAIATDDHPAVRTALAAVANAERNLDKTTVIAPADGVISQVESLNVGQFVAPGSVIASLVETGSSWVEANFKETQLTGMKVGQNVEVSIDAFPDTVLHGKIGSIGAATGAEFSLIPAQNATGNWVKVVQRISVRVELEDAGDVGLRSGMSSNVSVDTGKTRLDAML